MSTASLTMIGAIILSMNLAPAWTMVWHDEFKNHGLPNPANWGYEVGYVRNHEAQFYTDGRLANAFVDRKGLHIEALKDGFEGHPITSASLTTLGKHSWTYGRFEVAAKIPEGLGTWPAIWMLGTNTGEVGWPKGGEIDIMENVGFMPGKVFGTVHGFSKLINGHFSKGGNITIPHLEKGFHVYRLDWTKSELDFYVDNKEYFSYPNTGEVQYNSPMYLILNLAIGGAWGGQKGVDDSIFPAHYDIKWVRVYQQK